MSFVIVTIATVAGFVLALVVPTAIVLHAKGQLDAMSRILPATGAKVTGDRRDDVDLDMLMLDFLVEWGRRFGGQKALSRAFERMRVQWMPGQWFEDPSAPGMRLAGLTASKRYIKVADRDGAPLGKTAVAHELCHVALWVTVGEPDPNHTNPERWDAWTDAHQSLIADINQRFLT